jgi:hypothetical protein
MMHWLRPSPARGAAYRLFGFTFALTLAGTYLLAIQFTSGVRWLPHELVGCALGCGFVGLMLSYLGVGPAVSSDGGGLASSGLAPDAREAAGVAGRQPLP